MLLHTQKNKKQFGRLEKNRELCLRKSKEYLRCSFVLWYSLLLSFINQMEERQNSWKENREEGTLFSRVVKAGKRLYYVDVKRDRNGEYYISMTESKRVKEGTDTERPQFEKHKLFLYREDILKFLTALTDAAQYVGEHRSLVEPSHGSSQGATHRATSSSTETALDANFEVEF